MTIQNRIDSLRVLIKKYKLDAYIVPGTDDHQNEYVPDQFKRREWITGFTGSAGDFIIMHDVAALWTDSRYFLQAVHELSGTETILLKAGEIEFPDLFSWAQLRLKSGQSIGIDPRLISFEDACAQKKKLTGSRLRLKYIDRNLVDILWKEKPCSQKQPVFIHPITKCGEDFKVKLEHLREKMKESCCDAHIITSLDSIAWLFNIRGSDIAFNPLVIAHTVITISEAILFIDPEKITSQIKEYFEGHVSIRPYQDFHPYCLKTTSLFDRVWIDPKRTDFKTASIFFTKKSIIENESPVYYFKSIKNDVEIASIKNVMIHDGIAMVKFLSWLDARISDGRLSEMDSAAQLDKFRQEHDDYRGMSFHTISAFGPHGAIVHYSASETTNAPITSPGIYLVDSGGHYTGGTTDITRTIAIGTPTKEQVERYTLVLKGHISLALAAFPKGTKGVQLDMLARKPLWDAGLDYGHGTGHGVGFYLNVHEGPQSISPSKLAAPGLEPGMLITDEPGFYKEGEYGIRIENILLVVPWKQKSEREAPFYRFQTLTLCPYERRLIDPALLTQNELDFIDSYHARVRELILPLIDCRDISCWLIKNTDPIT